ncbi:MAG: tetratricopeptide repeat protein [Spirochaetota bacterium]|nr:tetratricopeptide repeat protein [Spirochaetota bacterium]
MITTYGIIFVFAVLLIIFGLYILNVYVIPRKIDEIAQMIESGQTKLAIKKLNEMLEKDERNSYAHYLLAEAYMKDKNIQYAIPEYRQVLKLGKYDDKLKEVNVRSKLAKIYKDRNAFDEAKKEFLILTKLDPDNYENYFELGLIFHNEGKIDKSISFFRKSISLNKEHAQSYFYLGQCHYRKEGYQDAKQMFVQAIKLDHAIYKAHYFLGLVLRALGDYEWAIKEFEIAEKDNDIKVRCFLAKGMCYLDRDQFPKAIMEFGRGLKYSRRGSDTELNLLYFMGNAHEKMRDLHSAIACWERIVEVKKNFRDVQDKLQKYAEFRQDDRIKDFMIAGLSQFEHSCRKIVESMGYIPLDINIEDLEIEVLATEMDGKWRNIRKTNKIIKILRNTDIVSDRFLRKLYESMKPKNATRVIVISAGDFSQTALDFANTRPIDLFGKKELVDLLKKIYQ